MTKLLITGQDGTEHVLDAPNGYTVMEVIRDADLGLPAICGGGCDCATCHILLTPEWFEKVGGPNEFEEALVEEAPEYDPKRSRLSCQITVSAEIDGLKATLPQSWL